MCAFVYMYQLVVRASSPPRGSSKPAAAARQGGVGESSLQK